MDQRSTSFWKLRLAALGLGIITLTVVYAIAVKFSNDLRLIYADGTILLFCGAAWLSWKKEDWFAVVLLIAPLVAMFSYEVLAKIPALWPALVLWVVAAALGLVLLRTFRKQTKVAIALIAMSGSPALVFCQFTPPSSERKTRPPTVPCATLE